MSHSPTVKTAPAATSPAPAPRPDNTAQAQARHAAALAAIATEAEKATTIHLPAPDEIAQHEAELDTIHPDWRHPDRARRRFDDAPYAKMARIKWLLKRRELCLKGLQHWTVKIVPDGFPPRRCFAHAIPPREVSTQQATDEPPRWSQ